MKRIIVKQSICKVIILLYLLILTSCNINNSYCFVYSKNSNVLHKVSCGEIVHIKPENHVETKDSLTELFAKGFRLCNVCFRDYKKTDINSKSIIAFKTSLKNEFNFCPYNEKNNKILDMLVDLYIGIYEEKGNLYDANIEYHRLLSSIIYHDNSLSYSNFEWKVVSTLYTDKKTIIEKISMYFKNIYNNPNSIYGNKYLEHIYNSVMQQYNLANEGINGNDFAHLSATLCALDNEKNVSKQVNRYASLYNGIENISAQAGYIGDICGANGKEPSLNAADYKADLDAINLYNLYVNENSSILNILAGYYNNINANNTNRADLFLKNIGNEVLSLQRVKYLDNLREKYFEGTYEFCNRLNYFDNFLQHIKNADQNFLSCRYKKYNEYESNSKFSKEEIIESYNAGG